MKKRKPSLPKIDLSKYENKEERITTKIETIIIQTIIFYGGNIRKTSETLNLSIERINDIFIEYYFQISKIIEAKEKNIETSDSLNKAINIYNSHITEIKNLQDKSNFKMLSNNNSNSLNRSVDRVIQIMKENTSQYEKTYTELTNSIIKQKNMELQESGKIDNSLDYFDNQKSVFDLLSNYKLPTTKGVQKRIICKNQTTGEEFLFDTISDFADYIDVPYLKKNFKRHLTIVRKKAYSPPSGKHKGEQFAFDYYKEDE